MTDHNIRKLTVAEQAQAAARRTVDSGVIEENPHVGTQDGPDWKSAYERYMLQFSAPDAEASA
jgi:hypothetical protein